jgi:hypothetical protein
LLAGTDTGGLMRRFFSGAENFDFFKGNQVFQTRAAEFLRKIKADRSGRPSFATIYFLRAIPGRCIRKIVTKFPGGGRAAMTLEGAT